MGGSLAKCGDVFSCMRKNNNADAVGNHVPFLYPKLSG